MTLKHSGLGFAFAFTLAASPLLAAPPATPVTQAVTPSPARSTQVPALTSGARAQGSTGTLQAMDGSHSHRRLWIVVATVAGGVVATILLVRHFHHRVECPNGCV